MKAAVHLLVDLEKRTARFHTVNCNFLFLFPGILVFFNEDRMFDSLAEGDLPHFRC